MWPLHIPVEHEHWNTYSVKERNCFFAHLFTVLVQDPSKELPLETDLAATQNAFYLMN